ncbi:MAG: O-antigen ligase family protein [Acidobacteriota bacterium]|nr:O-antigen ligase family protein [Acidobacteriota bacterium]
MKFLRIGICALVAFGVLTHGGVEEWARACFETGAGVLFVGWAIGLLRSSEENIVISPLLPPLVALLLVVLGQLAFFTTDSPFATHEEFRLLLADTLVLFLAAQAFRTLEDWREFVWFVMIFGFLVATFGILQHLTFNGKLYWFREMHYGGIPFGPYVNRNHFAGFAELFIPMALVPLMLGKVRRERLFIVGLFAVVSIGSLFLAASRGGVISFAVQVVVIVGWMAFRRTGTSQMLVGAAVLLAALLMVSWLGVKEITQRFSTMKAMEVASGKRASMRKDTWQIFLDHPWMGTGLGTLQTVFPPYETQYDGRIVNHSHNDYVEALADTGVAGGLCCALFLGLLLFHSLTLLSGNSSPFATVLNLSGLVGCIGFLVHSFADFNLHLPANALLFFLMALLATSTLNAFEANTRESKAGRRRKGKH